VDALPRLALTPIAVGIWLEGEEPSDVTGALGRKKGKAAPRRQSGTARLEDLVYPPNKGSNPEAARHAPDSLTLRPLEQERVWSPGAIASRAEAHM
jgi:hypothetical protein